MGKNSKRKQSNSERNERDPSSKAKPKPATKKRDTKNPPLTATNPLLTAQQKFLESLSPPTRTHFFSPKHVTPEQRAEVWENQADVGETLVNSYAWATPDPRLLKVFQHFGPIVEVGCGANAYWSKWMNGEGGVDVIALDVSLDAGGKIISGTTSENKSSKKKAKKNKANNDDSGLVIRQGSPETLSEDATIRDSGRTLFLCYPDEEEYQAQDNDDDDDEEEAPPTSMGGACLEHFTGSTIIHVGELFGDTLSLDQAPFGRSSSNEFQQRLAGEYHCILKMKLENNWLHVRDTLSVWKRSETCCMAFQNEDDEEEDEEDDEVYYKYIPPAEVLPVDLAAPCVAHLLGKSDGSTREKDAKVDEIHESDALSPETGQVNIDTKRGKSSDGGKKKMEISNYDDDDEEDEDAQVIAGDAW